MPVADYFHDGLGKSLPLVALSSASVGARAHFAEGLSALRPANEPKNLKSKRKEILMGFAQEPFLPLLVGVADPTGAFNRYPSTWKAAHVARLLLSPKG
jgi:hypothetical protein